MRSAGSVSSLFLSSACRTAQVRVSGVLDGVEISVSNFLLHGFGCPVSLVLRKKLWHTPWVVASTCGELNDLLNPDILLFCAMEHVIHHCAQRTAALSAGLILKRMKDTVGMQGCGPQSAASPRPCT